MYVANNVASGGHVAFVRFRFGDVYDLVKEVRLSVLSAEVLKESVWPRHTSAPAGTYPAEYVIVIGEMRLAVPAAVDAPSIEVDIVCETHSEPPSGVFTAGE